MVYFSVLWLGKEDLYITPQCLVCDLYEEKVDNQFYNIYYENKDDRQQCVVSLDFKYEEREQCSVNPPEICVEADHKMELNSYSCALNMDSDIDFGGRSTNVMGTWLEDWQN
jgi:hypothetical protein